jgi:hypothetical protein
MADFERLIAIRAEMKTEIKTNQERLEAKIEANNEKFEVLRGALVSGMESTRQAKTEANREEVRQLEADQLESYQLKPTEYEVDVRSSLACEDVSRGTSTVGRRYQAVQ